MSEGQLFEASELLKVINHMIDDAPHSLARADVINDLKVTCPLYLSNICILISCHGEQKKLQTADHRISEQLEGTLTSCISISSSGLIIRPVVPVPNSAATVSLAHILVALPTSSLAGHLATLRRDLTMYFIDFLLAQPASLNISEESTAGETIEHRVAVFPDPPNDEDPTKRLANMSSLLTFLNENLFPHLPDAHAASFKLSLCRPLTQALLTRLLEPLLPSDADSLPTYIHLIERAVHLEDTFIGPVLGDDSSERPVASWSHGLVGHYERKRRVALLEHTRSVITAPEGGFGSFQVEITIRTETTVADTVQVEQVTSPTTVEGLSTAVPTDEEDAWGLESESPNTLKTSRSKTSADEWGLDSREEKPTSPSKGTPHQSTFSPRNAPSVLSASSSVSSLLDTDADEDAWGFDDGDGDASSSPTTAPTEGSERAEDKLPKVESEPLKSVDAHPSATTELDGKPPEDDDPWGDDPWAEPSASTAEPLSVQPPQTGAKAAPVLAPAPKVAKAPAKKATRLERLANKGKANVTSPVTSPIGAPKHASNGSAFLSNQQSSSSTQASSNTEMPRTTVTKAPPAPVRTAPLVLHEHYTCSTRAKDIFDLVHSMIDESERLARSDIFSNFATTSSSVTRPGAILAQSASAALDLYRALYPVAFAGLLKSSAGVGMKLGNDALWLCGELGKLRLDTAIDGLTEAVGAFEGAKEHMKAFADRAYEECVRTQENSVEDVLSKADGFVNCGDQECYDRCEEAISKAVRQIRSVAHSWKVCSLRLAD
jgi:centromere/kinetochore protein ZW10